MLGVKSAKYSAVFVYIMISGSALLPASEGCSQSTKYESGWSGLARRGWYEKLLCSVLCCVCLSVAALTNPPTPPSPHPHRHAP